MDNLQMLNHRLDRYSQDLEEMRLIHRSFVHLIVAVLMEFEEKNTDAVQHVVYQHSIHTKSFSVDKLLELTGGPGVNCRSVVSPLGQSASVNEFTELGCPG